MKDILDHEYTDGELEYFREFLNVEEANDLAQLLEKNNILYSLEKPQVLIDKAIVGTTILPKVVLKILPRDFEQVNRMLANIIEQQAVPEGHYLLDFDDLELFEVIKKPDSWNIEDVTMARKILVNRGFEITNQQLQELQEQRFDELKAGKDGSLSWMIFYAFCVVLGVVFLHPLFMIAGVGMGFYYWQDKRRDPKGAPYFTFNKKTRIAGQIIFYLGIGLMIVLFILLFLNAHIGLWSELY
jgi:hypothetical protein